MRPPNKGQRACSNNTVMKYMERLKKLTNIAIDNKWITEDTFGRFERHIIKKDRASLDEFELERFIHLTTRTTILNDARENYEKLNRSDIDLSNQELQLTDYGLEDKGRILYNHLFHSSINDNFKREIFERKNY